MQKRVCKRSTEIELRARTRQVETRGAGKGQSLDLGVSRAEEVQ